MLPDAMYMYPGIKLLHIVNATTLLFILALGGTSVCFGQETGSYTDHATLVSLVGEADARSFSDVLDRDHEFEFRVYVPDNYDPAEPPGLLVHVSPVASGEIPESWKEVFERRSLIWVSVNKSGNSVPQERRLADARLSPTFIRQNYEINAQRIYISGMSGGGQISSIAAPLYPNLFQGGIFICGVNPWSERAVDPWLENPPEDFETMKDNRYVFVSGTEDFKLAATARVYRLYKKAGVESSKLIVVDEMGHELPDAATFDKALGFLDADSMMSEAPAASD